jgi:hypothetical protein
MCPLFCPILTKLKIFSTYFSKITYLFRENATRGAKLFHAGGQQGCNDEANGRFSQRCESAQNP